MPGLCLAVWGQTVIWQGPAAVFHGFDRVRILFQPLDPGYYAVFARLMVAPHGGTVEWEHAAYVQMMLGAATDETYGRLVVGGFSDELVKASTPVSLMTVGESDDTGRGGVDLAAVAPSSSKHDSTSSRSTRSRLRASTKAASR